MQKRLYRGGHLHIRHRCQQRARHGNARRRQTAMGLPFVVTGGHRLGGIIQMHPAVLQRQCQTGILVPKQGKIPSAQPLTPDGAHGHSGGGTHDQLRIRDGDQRHTALGGGRLQPPHRIGGCGVPKPVVYNIPCHTLTHSCARSSARRTSEGRSAADDAQFLPAGCLSRHIQRAPPHRRSH